MRRTCPSSDIGANTTNPVFGATRNPWNTDLTCGGSSGGAAVSVATGEVWLAAGSDGGCSLRVPASFCSVTTLRPTPGSRRFRHDQPRRARAIRRGRRCRSKGPIGRTVGDVALMFEAQIGAHRARSDDRCRVDGTSSHSKPSTCPTLPKRIAFSRDLGGVTRGCARSWRCLREGCRQALRRSGRRGRRGRAPTFVDARRRLPRPARAFLRHAPMARSSRRNRDRVRARHDLERRRRA